MKFLYLKGTEVLGPIEVGHLLKESWFSDDLLVCPEDKAEQESAWKSAKDYPEFKLSLEQEIFPFQESISNTVSDTPVKEEPKVNPKAPVQYSPDIQNNEAKVQDNLRELPPLEDTKTDSSTDLKKKEEDLLHEIVAEDVPAHDAILTDNIPQDHTFHISNKNDDNLLEDLPSDILLEPKEQQSQTAPVVLGEDNSALNTLTSDEKNNSEVKDHTTPLKEAPLPAQNTANGTLEKHSFLEISNNKILSSSDGRVKKSKKNDLIFILSFLVITVVAIALCLAFLNMGKEDTNTASAQGQNNQGQETSIIEQEKFQTNPFENEQENALAKQLPINSEDKADQDVIDIVKNTKLKNKGITIGDYLQNVYGQDYQSSWSAKPFTDNIYIVEFFASKVRTEPFVYLFRVDIEQQKITGALNNITLDLIG